jgi:hypothetical protein
MYKFWQIERARPNFGRFFHQLIRSPWFWPVFTKRTEFR